MGTIADLLIAAALSCLPVAAILGLIFAINRNLFLTAGTRGRIAESCGRGGLVVVSCRPGGFLGYLDEGFHSSVAVYRLVVADSEGIESGCLCVMRSRFGRPEADIRLVFDDPDEIR